MDSNNFSLSFNEKVIFTLRELYSKHGYSQYRMSKFEEYDLYARNKDFLISEDVITFTDTNGKLMALKPDVTLSIIKNIKDDSSQVKKLYYNENVYRVSKGSDSFKELMQVGLETIGNIGEENISEVLSLAAKSLKSISGACVLDVSHLGLLNSVVDSLGVSSQTKTEILSLVGEKNIPQLKKLCMEAELGRDKTELLVRLVSLSGNVDEVTKALRQMPFCPDDMQTVEEFYRVLDGVAEREILRIDFSAVNDTDYYNGIVFKGFIEGVPTAVLSGGNYDNLMKKMGRKSGAIGFAVYLDELEHISAQVRPGGTATINIALPKGRLGEKVYKMFEKAGYGCEGVLDNSRKLIFENNELSVRYFWVKPSDVAIYVERGAADIGVAGKDILLEYEPEVYELLDLNIGKCRMAVAAKKGFCDNTEKTLRVATKFTNIARSHYMSLGRDIDIIKLNGSIEIAPILDLADVIVDIVETGTTLKENNLEVIDTIVPISARLVANKASLKFKGQKIQSLAESISALSEAKE